MALPLMPSAFAHDYSHSVSLVAVLPALFSSCLPAVSVAQAVAVGPQLGADSLPVNRVEPVAALRALAPRQVVFALIDGMGLGPLRERLAHAPFLRSVLADQQAHLRAVSVCPSTTAAAITSALTGAHPGDHNMLSYSLWDRESDNSFNLINFRGSMVQPQDFQRVPTIFERLGDAGLESVALGPARFIGNGLTLAALRGARYVASEDISTRVQDALRAVREGVALTYFYVSEVDHAGHNRGWASTQWAAQLEQVDSALGALAAGLPPEVLLVITADHGMVDSVPEMVIDVADLPQVAPLVQMVAGEGRAAHFYARPGSGEELVHGLRQLLDGQQHWVLSRAQMVELLQKWGAAQVVRADLLGDAVVFSAANWQVLDSRFYAPGAWHMIGVHGSLTPAELQIPLLLHRN